MSSFFRFPAELRVRIYQCLLHDTAPLDGKPNIWPSILRTSKQIYQEAHHILYHGNTLLVRVALRYDEENGLEAHRACPCFSNCRYVCRRIFEPEDFIKQFQRFKIIIMCDEVKHLKIVRPAVRTLCKILSRLKLRSLDISLDCRESPRNNDMDREENYRDPEWLWVYKKIPTREHWNRHFPDGILEALRPFRLLRNVSRINFDEVPIEDVVDLKATMQSDQQNVLQPMVDELDPWFCRLRSLKEDLEQAVETGNTLKYLARINQVIIPVQAHMKEIRRQVAYQTKLVPNLQAE